MSTGRTIVAGVVGGIFMFVWGAISHMATPLGEMGMSSMPAAFESAVMPQMKAALPGSGLYFFPGMTDKSEAGMKAWQEKIRQGPQGMLVFKPEGSEVMTPSQLAAEWGTNTMASVILAVIVARMNISRGKRVLLCAALGLFAWLSIDASYVIWYHFPCTYAVAQAIDQTMGCLAAGVGIALVLGRPVLAVAVK